jgi:L-ascorbate metabolism protein UlaG (beta-lactamase superfamily)
MRIKWYGQSCFLIVSENEVKIVTDPFGKLPYHLPDVQPDIVTVSHEHMDHNNTKGLRGNFALLNKPVETALQDVKIKGVETYHDNAGGSKRGKNTVFLLTVDGIAICHLGDLGHILNEDQIRMIGEVDILLLPVGGRVTIDAKDATKVRTQLQPAITIPMHYRTKAMGPFGLLLSGENKFLDSITDKKVELNELVIKKDELAEKSGIITLAYQH